LRIKGDFPMTRQRPTLLSARNDGDCTAVALVGENIALDEEAALALAQQLFSLVDQFGGRHYVLDLANVHYLTSTTLDKLVVLNGRLRGLGGKLTLCNLNPQVHELFNVTGLSEPLHVREPGQAPADPEKTASPRPTQVTVG